MSQSVRAWVEAAKKSPLSEDQLQLAREVEALLVQVDCLKAANAHYRESIALKEEAIRLYREACETLKMDLSAANEKLANLGVKP